MADNPESLDRTVLLIGGERLPAGGHAPILLSDETRVWLVREGDVELYVVAATTDGRTAVALDRRLHVASFGAGDVLFGFPEPACRRAGIALIAVPSVGTEIFRGRRASVTDGDFDLAYVDWVEGWVALLTSALTAGDAVPNGTRLIEADPGQPFTAGSHVAGHRGVAMWASVAGPGATYLGRPAAPLPPSGLPIPLTERSWLSMAADNVVSAELTPTIFLRGELAGCLDQFHAVALTCLAELLRKRTEADQRLAATRELWQGHKLRAALAQLAGTVRALPGLDALPPPPLSPDHSSLFATLQIVARALDLKLMAPRHSSGSTANPLQSILDASHLSARRIRLSGTWYRQEFGPLLGGMKADGRPVALLPRKGGRYRLIDPASESGPRLVERELAEQISEDAYLLYRPLPDEPADTRTLRGYLLRGMAPELWRIGIMALLGGLVMMITPVATGRLLAKVAPRADLELHLSLVAALIAGGIGAAMFQLVRSFALLRIEGTATLSFQAAIWDRLMKLPPAFFRNYAAGDLADRANGITVIRQSISVVATNAVLGVVTATFSFALMFWYSWRLALIASLLVLVLMLATYLISRMQVQYLRREVAHQGALDALVFQLLTGITKLRVAYAERFAFGRWADEFAQQKSHALSARRWRALLSALGESYPLLANLCLFVTIHKLGEATSENGLDLASFLSFNSAFGQFLPALVNLVNAVTQVTVVGALWERLAPILTTNTEIGDAKTRPGELTGDIEVAHLTFRYQPEAPPAVDGVSLHIRAGQFVAIVGESGSGKSTLLRLLLGFEAPQSGTIYLDGEDLASLDHGAVRRQFGVVLQAGRLQQGSIFDNIAGSLALTQSDAWHAIELAGLESDIRAMPMGLQTVLTEGGGPLSGGQKQRLMIARALVRKPRILFFDEATSALDNVSQSVINQSLSRLSVTRIVIAHRLSTIQDADIIHVMHAGRIVESGTHASLLAQRGMFAALARRQLI